MEASANICVENIEGRHAGDLAAALQVSMQHIILMGEHVAPTVHIESQCASASLPSLVLGPKETFNWAALHYGIPRRLNSVSLWQSCEMDAI